MELKRDGEDLEGFDDDPSSVDERASQHPTSPGWGEPLQTETDPPVSQETILLTILAGVAFICAISFLLVMHITGLDLVPLAQEEFIVRKGRDEVLQAAATSILNAVLQQNHALPHVLWALSDIQKVVSVGPLESFCVPSISLVLRSFCSISVRRFDVTDSTTM